MNKIRNGKMLKKFLNEFKIGISLLKIDYLMLELNKKVLIIIKDLGVQ